MPQSKKNIANIFYITHVCLLNWFHFITQERIEKSQRCLTIIIYLFDIFPGRTSQKDVLDIFKATRTNCETIKSSVLIHYLVNPKVRVDQNSVNSVFFEEIRKF